MSVSRRKFLCTTAMLPTLSLPILAKSTGFQAAAGLGGSARRDVSSLPVNAEELVAYERAVGLLKRLPAQDPRSWAALARQHQDHCPHGNWWFLPWHRAYLYYFEKCCQSVLSDPTFRLPYWDWSRNRQVPGAFWKLESSLYHPSRTAGPNDEMRAEVVGSAIVDRIIRSNVDVFVFSGATQSDDQRAFAASGTLEATPHNSVHNFIGGDMGGFMSPLDPIFWLHHANVDRLWASWSRIHNNRAPSEKRWADHKLTTFHDPESNSSVSPVTSTTNDVDRFNALYDRYEEVTGVPTVAAAVQQRLSKMQLFSLNTGPTLTGRIDRKISQATSASISLRTTQAFSSETEALIQASAQGDVPGVVLLVLGGVERVGSVSMRVFINCPNPSVITPTDDPTYAGTVSFFGDEHAGHGGGINILIDVTETLINLAAAGTYVQGQNLDVSLVAVDLRNPERRDASAVVKPETVEIKVIN